MTPHTSIAVSPARGVSATNKMRGPAAPKAVTPAPPRAHARRSMKPTPPSGRGAGAEFFTGVPEGMRTHAGPWGEEELNALLEALYQPSNLGKLIAHIM